MSPRKPSHYPAGLAVLVALVITFTGFLIGCTAGGQLKPGAAMGLDLGFAFLCPLQGLAAPGLAGACPAESAAFDAVVGTATAPSSPTPAASSAPSCTATSSPTTSSSGTDGGAGAPALVPLFRRGVAPGPALIHIGSLPPGPEASAAAHRALALPPAPAGAFGAKPPPASSSSSASSPPAAPILDAGADR